MELHKDKRNKLVILCQMRKFWDTGAAILCRLAPFPEIFSTVMAGGGAALLTSFCSITGVDREASAHFYVSK